MSGSVRSQAVAAELLALRDADGLIRPPKCVAWAKRHRTSALYGSLEWDNSVAADRWREQQVRWLIAVTLVDADGYRTEISLSFDRVRGGGGYRSISDVVSDDTLADVMLRDALRDLERVEEKYRHLKDLRDVWLAAHAARGRAAKRRTASAKKGKPTGRAITSGGGGAPTPAPG